MKVPDSVSSLGTRLICSSNLRKAALLRDFQILFGMGSNVEILLLVIFKSGKDFHSFRKCELVK